MSDPSVRGSEFVGDHLSDHLVRATAWAELCNQACDGPATGAGAERLWLPGIAEWAEGMTIDPAIHDSVVPAARAGLDDRRDARPAEIPGAVLGALVPQANLPAARAGSARVGALFAGRAGRARPPALPLIPADRAYVGSEEDRYEISR